MEENMIVDFPEKQSGVFSAGRKVMSDKTSALLL